MDYDRLNKQMDFLIEVDKLKTILRQSVIADKSKRENDAEHSWHFALISTILYEYCDTKKVNLTRVLKMALIHDLVEIYAGDTFAYDIEGYKDKEEREFKAATKIFGLLPDDQTEEYKNLWEEFERMETPDAIYASTIDRLQPFLLNHATDGHTWKQGEVKSNQVYNRIGVLKESMPSLWEYIDQIIKDSIKKGYIKEWLTWEAQ